MHSYQELVRRVDNIILDHKDKILSARFDFGVNDLSSVELSECVNHYFIMDDCDLYSLTENKRIYEIEKCLRNNLRFNTLDEKIELANTLRDCMIEYYKDNLKSLIDERITDFRIDYFSAQGFVSHKYAENGETYWSKQHA